MTHPSDIGFVNCQQISVLSVPARALVGPGPVSSGEWHRASSWGCSPGSTPFPSLLPYYSPWWLKSRTASQHPAARRAFSPPVALGEMTGTKFTLIFQQNMKPKISGPDLKRLGYPSHPDIFCMLYKGRCGSWTPSLELHLQQKTVWNLNLDAPCSHMTKRLALMGKLQPAGVEGGNKRTSLHLAARELKRKVQENFLHHPTAWSYGSTRVWAHLASAG